MAEYIVLVGREHYNPLGIVRTLGEHGIKPITIIVKGDLRMIAHSKYVKKNYYVKNLQQGIDIIIKNYAKDTTEKSYILTGDDVSVSILDKNYDKLKDYFYFYNAGESGKITKYMDKSLMIELAKKHGLHVAKTWEVNVGEIPDDIEYPIMTKAINSLSSEWKNIVHICNNESELVEVFNNIKSDRILLQKYINKIDEVSFDGISVNNGKDCVILTEVYQEYCIPDKYSPYWKIKNNTNIEITKKIKNIIEEIGFDGIFEFEFLIDKNNILWFLEINFRNTALGYATTIVDMPQVILWCDAIKTKKIQNNYYKQIPDGITAMAECFDYDVRVKGKIVDKKIWQNQYRKCNCKLYRGNRDFLPYLLFLIYKYTKMNKNK